MVDDTDTMQFSDDSGADSGGGQGGPFDPSSPADSVVGGIGDAASSLWHAAGHIAEGVYDGFRAGAHHVAAGWDAYRGEYDDSVRQMWEGYNARQDRDREFHQAGQDLWGN